MKVYQVNDLVKLLKVTRLTIYNDIKAGKLKGNKIGNKWIFTEEAVKNYIEGGNDMKKIVIECLEVLKEEDLLNVIGEKLAEQPEKFPETIENMADYFEGQSKGYILDKLSTSSLVGADDELAIEQWIDEEEKETMYQIIDMRN